MQTLKRGQWKQCLVFIGLFSLLISSCKVEDKLSHQNFKNLYSQEIESMEFGTRVYYESPDSFRVFLSFQPNKVFQHIDKNIEQYTLTIHSTYFENLEAAELIDSFTVKQNLSFKAIQGQSIQTSFKAPILSKAQIFQVQIADARFAQQYTSLLNLNDPGIDCAQNYIPISGEKALTSTYLTTGSTLSIAHKNSQKKTIYVTYYTGEFNAALPTFVNDEDFSYDLQVDSTFPISPGQEFRLNREGVYAFSIDTFKRVGLSLLAVREDYPEITDPREMLESLRYITSNFEFEGMLENDDPKKQVDEFWLQRSGSFERGRTLVQSYYSRIERANKMFPSFMEGWKTDRGLVSIVHGEPDWIYKNPKSEEWIYLDRKGNKALSFYFLHLKNPLSDQHFYLLRQPEFRDSWNKAVHDWRSGKIPE